MGRPVSCYFLGGYIMKPIFSALVDGYFSTAIQVTDFSPRIMQKVLIQGDSSPITLRKLSKLVPRFFLLFEQPLPLITFPNQLGWSWKQQLDWSRFRGQCSFFSFWKGLRSVLLVTAGCQNHCKKQEMLKTQLQYKVHSGPYRKESRTSALRLP